MMVRAISNLKLNNHSSLLLVESGVFPALFGILQGDNIHARVAILRALRHLTEIEQSRVTFAQLGAAVILVNCLKTDHKKLRLVSYTTTHVICIHSEEQPRLKRKINDSFSLCIRCWLLCHAPKATKRPYVNLNMDKNMYLS
jgi:hypothetical protein